MFIKWPSIEGLHNLRKSHQKRQTETGWIPPPVFYRPKVKLHGTNAAVQVVGPFGDFRIVTQSRSNIITPENDNMGFAKWAAERENWFIQYVNGDGGHPPPLVFFGEFCGKGVMKGVAVSELDKRIFVIFALLTWSWEFKYPEQGYSLENGTLIVDPDEIRKTLVLDSLPPDTYILPWYDKGIWVDWLDREELERSVAFINNQVEEVEKCDPWIKETFGIEGTGEGLVYYPITYPNCPPRRIRNGRYDTEWFSHNVFKAKGEKHKNVKKSAPAQIDPAIAENATAFADMFMTDARLEQAVNEACAGEYDIKKMGAFLAWIGHDTKKESKDELEASKLEWKMVAKYVTTKAREWYLAKIRDEA